ncbi:phospholipase A [Psychrobacter sp. TAE2020]|uniref:phospholipase A n=1 Tax=Psychrobacter sp. TAE2020 TaxID=2846762 RepID=UPI001C115F49|nr:phospholipase A [Psychrobacter sp. TAE2020]MBU5616830.1 phospholipase A [Psychrobacter sp. TAE2020]
MSADFISPRHSVTFVPTYLSIAIGVTLSCFAFSAQAATSKTYNELSVSDVLVEQDNNVPKVIYNRLKTPSTPVSSRETASKELVAKQTQLFFDCTQVQTDGARLACFDKVANQGETNLATKQSLDLVKTLKTTITGSPQVVLTVDTDLDNVQNTDRLLANQAADNEPLSTVGLTKNEAKVLEDAGVTQTDLEKYTPLSLAYDLDKNSERGTWTIRPHNPNYVLPLFYTAKPNLSPNSPSLDGGEFTSNDIRNTELKFQLSLKSKVAEDLFGTNADLWFGYTQDSHWQVYNEDNSRPFRATDYQPEIFLTQPVTANLPFGGRLRMLGLGAMHHSNGKSEPVSRSWNRIYLMGGAEWGKFSIVPRIWARVKNEDESSEDNADIEDFMGHGDVKFLYDLPKQQSISGTLRYNTSTNKGAAQIDYVYPLTKNVNGYVQLFQGYGESIIDYNHETTAVGVGIVLNDWKGF